ncbi:MAG: hypothetical protein KY393_06380 [Actinobacteria bacterium]|nr:hypothetical protein [Actinomycetota bacterium]
MPREFRDFDAAADAKEPLRFRVAGEDHELPADIPAHLVFSIRRQAKNVKNDDDAESFGLQLIEDLMGKERWERITQKMGIDTATELVEWIMTEYGFGEEEQGDPKEVEETTSPSSTSTPTGIPSNGSTNVFGLRPGGPSSHDSQATG